MRIVSTFSIFWNNLLLILKVIFILRDKLSLEN